MQKRNSFPIPMRTLRRGILCCFPGSRVGGAPHIPPPRGGIPHCDHGALAIGPAGGDPSVRSRPRIFPWRASPCSRRTSTEMEPPTSWAKTLQSGSDTRVAWATKFGPFSSLPSPGSGPGQLGGQVVSPFETAVRHPDPVHERRVSRGFRIPDTGGRTASRSSPQRGTRDGCPRLFRVVQKLLHVRDVLADVRGLAVRPRGPCGLGGGGGKVFRRGVMSGAPPAAQCSPTSTGALRHVPGPAGGDKIGGRAAARQSLILRESGRIQDSEELHADSAPGGAGHASDRKSIT